MIRVGLSLGSIKLKCECEPEMEQKKILRRDQSYYVKFGSSDEGLLLEECISLTTYTKIIFTLSQKICKKTELASTSKTILAPFKYVEYKIAIFEEVNGILKRFTGKKNMNYHTFTGPNHRRVSANILLTDRIEDVVDFSDYELRLSIMVKEPIAHGWTSEFKFY
nr:uncharacterized protein LOC111425633 [Onthophagus taurus]